MKMSRTYFVSAALFLTIVSACTERRVPPADSATAEQGSSKDSGADAAVMTGVDAGRPDLATEATLALAIPARAQAPESPPSGWCGETAIQEGIIYLGMWAPQRLINKAGKPLHPDLYATEISTALHDLGVKHVFYGQGRGYEPFAKWTQKALTEGDPVLAGVKILPTEHPDWGLDHFVLAMGYGPKGLLVNTTWGHREWVADTTTRGLSLKNAFYGIRLLGLQLTGANANRARASLIDEGETTVKLHVACIDPKPGKSYRIEQRAHAYDKTPVWSADVTSTDVSVPVDQTARFQCVTL